MAILKGNTTISGDIFVTGRTYSEDGFIMDGAAMTYIADSITSRTNKLAKFSGETEALALSIISDAGSAVTVGTSVASHTLNVKSTFNLYDTDTTHYATLTAGNRTTNGTFTLPNVTTGTLATINNAATWTAVQTHNANIEMGSGAEVVGNAQTATRLKYTRTLNGVDFNGTANVTVPTNIETALVSDPSYYVLFASGTSGNLQAKAHSYLYYDPITGTLHATAIDANLVGTEKSADNANNLTGNSPYTLPYQSADAQPNNPAYRLTEYVPPNTTTTRKFLRMQGTGSAGAAPVWDELGTITGTGATWQANVIEVKYGGTGLASLTANTIYKGDGENALVASGITDNGSTIALAANRNFSMPSGTGTFSQAFAGTTSTTSFASYHSGAKIAAFSAFNFSNSATSSTASITKTSLMILSEGTWNGAAAQNRSIYSRATGGTTNYSFYGDGGILYNKDAASIGGALGVAGNVSIGGTLGVTGDVTLTGSLAIGTDLLPDSNDGATLGSATVSWSDLFLASGAVINFNNGDVTLTHAADALTIAGGDVSISNTTASSSTTTGALKVAGGVGVAGDLWVGGSTHTASIYLEEDANSAYYLRLLNNSGLSANRTLNLNVNNADRTISLAGNLTLANNFTTSAGAVTINALSEGSTLTLPTTSTISSLTANHVLYASAANTIAGEAQLAISRGGTGAASVTARYALLGPTSSAAAPTWRAVTSADISDATSSNTASRIVLRDASGNFSAGTITAALSGNASTASKLETTRNIALTGAVTGNVNFDGSGDVSITTTATSDPKLTLDGDASGSATFTNLGNATLTVTVANDSHTHDTRYYTETESDTRFVNVDGDTMSGKLTVNNDIQIDATDGTDGFVLRYNKGAKTLDFVFVGV